MLDKPHKRKKFLKRLVIIFLSAIIFLLLLSTVLFYMYKDDIGRKILMHTNKMQKGELVFKDISFNPFIHFPAVSIGLSEVKYFEKSVQHRVIDSIPIIGLNYLYLSFDLLDLLKGNVNVSKILLEYGEVNLITYSDSTLNIVRAFDTRNDTTIKKNDTVNESEHFELDIDEIAIRNVLLKYDNIPARSKSAYSFEKFEASFNYWPDTIKLSIDADLRIESAKLSDGFTLFNKNISFDTKLSYSRENEFILIAPSRVSFEEANFLLKGYLEMASTGYINLDVKGDDKEFSILNIFLTNNGIENIQNGNIYFDGNINGMLFSGIPKFNFSFGMNKVEIKIPNTGQNIRNLNMEGSFSSGKEKDFSGAGLKINNLNADLPEGKLDGKFEISNFHSPQFDLNFYLKSDINGFDKIIDLGGIDSVSGIIEIKSEIVGRIDKNTRSFINKSNSSILKFDSVSFVIPGVNYIKNLTGRLESEADTLLFDDINLGFGKSDFNINGTLSNVFYIFFDIEKEIAGDLHIKSNTYDFPDFFKWDQGIATAFPYLIKDINLFVKPKTNTKDLVNYITTPRIEFYIDHLDAEIEEFLPPVNIRKGYFILADQDSSLNLDFSGFEIKLAGSDLYADVVFNSPWTDPDWLTVDLSAKNLNPKTAFVEWFNDSINDFLDGNLDGDMDLTMVISNDSSLQYDKLDFKAANLDYINLKDTFDVNNLRINAVNIAYDLSNTDNVMETLSFKTKMTVKTFNSNHFILKEIDDDITAEDGIYTYKPKNSTFFDHSVDGIFILRPFEKAPSYEFSYKVKDFKVSKLFTAFLEDTVLTGKMNINLEMKFTGHELDEIKKSLNGKIHFEGKDLTLYGLDLDKVIDRFKRSQRFTFADVGAIFLMGPAGILVTKGSDYANIVILNPGESSTVAQLSSDWDIKDGLINLSDVAFTTEKNRMAAKGFINLASDTLYVNFALLNNLGCSVFSQDLSGKLEEPEMGKVRVVKSLLAPVTNLLKTASGNECKVFYDGRVKHPEAKKN